MSKKSNIDDLNHYENLNETTLKILNSWKIEKQEKINILVSKLMQLTSDKNLIGPNAYDVDNSDWQIDETCERHK